MKAWKCDVFLPRCLASPNLYLPVAQPPPLALLRMGSAAPPVRCWPRMTAQGAGPLQWVMQARTAIPGRPGTLWSSYQMRPYPALTSWRPGLPRHRKDPSHSTTFTALPPLCCPVRIQWQVRLPFLVWSWLFFFFFRLLAELGIKTEGKQLAWLCTKGIKILNSSLINRIFPPAVTSRMPFHQRTREARKSLLRAKK